MAYLATAAIVVALATGPVHGAEKLPTAKSENVTKQTRQKVTELQAQFQKFQLSAESQECLDGKLVDPECDPTINGEINTFVSGIKASETVKRSNESTQRANELKEQNRIVSLASTNIEIVIGLVQLGLYVDHEKLPPKNADYMDIVMSNPNTPTDVQALFVDFLKRKKSGGTFSWKADGQRLINLAYKHLGIAQGLQSQINDEETKKLISEFYSQASSSFVMAKEMLAKKAGFLQ